MADYRGTRGFGGDDGTILYLGYSVGLVVQFSVLSKQ